MNDRIVLGEELAPGVPDTSDRGDGQQRGYVALSEEERAKGFVRPVRRTYIHVGMRPKHPTRDLTPEEIERYSDAGYVKFEPSMCRFWTAAQLASGCGVQTTMSIPLAETYARQPTFYGGTFCAHCRAHFSVGQYGEFVWADAPDERVGT
jgi:hypothetical protein